MRSRRGAYAQVAGPTSECGRGKEGTLSDHSRLCDLLEDELADEGDGFTAAA
jgi:hypothetical protein